jgi:hypothetical protein
MRLTVPLISVAEADTSLTVAAISSVVATGS